MTLVRWNPNPPSPIRELAGFHDEVDRLFENLLAARRPNGDGGSFVPPVDIDETADAFVLRIDLPGVPQDAIKVSLLGDMLMIRGERREEHRESQGSRLRTERILGVFERRFTLGGRVRSEGVQAVHRDGVLEVRVPKAEEAKVREIEVRTS